MRYFDWYFDETRSVLLCYYFFGCSFSFGSLLKGEVFVLNVASKIVLLFCPSSGFILGFVNCLCSFVTFVFQVVSIKEAAFPEEIT